jgi:hypothetical protein
VAQCLKGYDEGQVQAAVTLDLRKIPRLPAQARVFLVREIPLPRCRSAPAMAERSPGKVSGCRSLSRNPTNHDTLVLASTERCELVLIDENRPMQKGALTLVPTCSSASAKGIRDAGRSNSSSSKLRPSSPARPAARAGPPAPACRPFPGRGRSRGVTVAWGRGRTYPRMTWYCGEFATPPRFRVCSDRKLGNRRASFCGTCEEGKGYFKECPLSQSW